MILNLLNLYTLIFALFGKVNAMTSRLAVMKSNISRQGLNIADLLEHEDKSSSLLLTPIFNSTSETNAFYDVTQPTTLFILNATENPVDMETYGASTEPVTDQQDDEKQSLTGTCFQMMVDCSTLEIPTEAPTASISTNSPVATTTTTTTTTTTFISEEDELIYDDEEDYENVPERLKRQALLDQAETTTGNPSSLKSTPQSIGRLLDSLNSILRNLKRNTTIRIPYTTLPISTSTEPVPTTTTPAAVDAKTSEATGTPESLDDLMRWHTAGLILTTQEEEDVEDNSSLASSIYYDLFIFNQTDPPDELIATDNDTATTQHPAASSESPIRNMCPLVVCPWNDTVGYFSSLTTNIPGEEQDDHNGTSNGVPCRGDNPQGCTPFWTSSRDENITSFHSSVHFSSSTTLPNGKPFTI